MTNALPPEVPTEHVANLTEALLSWFPANTARFGLVADYPEVHLPGTPVDSGSPTDLSVLAREIAQRPENETMNWWACYYHTDGYVKCTAEQVRGLYRAGIDSIDPATDDLHACVFILVADRHGNLWWAARIDGRDDTLTGWAPSGTTGARPAGELVGRVLHQAHSIRDAAAPSGVRGSGPAEPETPTATGSPEGDPVTIRQLVNELTFDPDDFFRTTDPLLVLFGTPEDESRVGDFELAAVDFPETQTMPLLVPPARLIAGEQPGEYYGALFRATAWAVFADTGAAAPTHLMRATGGWDERRPLRRVYASVAATRTGTVWWAVEIAETGEQLSGEFAAHDPLPEGPFFHEVAEVARWLGSRPDGR
ncbi:hypothetical protein [Nocardia sp. NPDC024068]|uniref:hypothetical protein n=1 Tax=Nocardia sp. NPDC024068 TaxID=3157197 RepID=UPI0034017BB8